MKQVTILNFAFTLGGLSITYTNGTEKTTLKLDAKATCNLFEGAGIIEGFDIDANGEPVIYYTERIWNRPAPAYCMWFEYVKTFPFIQRHAEILIEYLIVTKQIRQSIAKIDYLLRPLKATA